LIQTAKRPSNSGCLNTPTGGSTKGDPYSSGSSRTEEFRLTLTMLGRCWHGTKSWQETTKVLAA